MLRVTATLATGGVVTSTNLAGGSTGKVIFGFTFNAPYTVPGEPKLNGFTISFSNQIAGVFNNPKIFESLVTSYSGGSVTQIPVGNVSAGTNSITVTLPGSRDLSNPTNATLTYFLMVDVDINASGSTPSIQPSLVDGGFGSLTNNNILVSNGSSAASVTTAQPYTFASIFPPILTSSYPAKGQLNVDPDQSTISMTFSVPVWSLDQKIFLCDQTAGTPCVQLNAANGAYDPLGVSGNKSGQPRTATYI
ncbi:MAG: hypothetical protein WDN75_10660 [Bacteroidota bacterium]